jgi:Ca2+-binding EF-hand superfamily protein
MNYKNTITATALALFVAASPAAFAKQDDKGKNKTKRSTSGDIYSQYDTNRDGRITRSEFPADPAWFDRADRNRDGVLTRSEAETFARSVNPETELRQLGVNRDGMVSRGEWRGDATAFQRLDRNRDGVLSQADRTASSSNTNRFYGLDRNRDGVVTRSEWRGNNTSFRNQDRNRDGVLSGSELRR